MSSLVSGIVRLGRFVMSSVEDVMDEFELYGLMPHGLPNAIGMWPNEQECLAWCALNSDEGNFMEIGTFCGGSAVLLGVSMRQLNRDKKVFSVDIDFKAYNMYDYNVARARLEGYCVPIECNSSNVRDKYSELSEDKISVCFIDGYHSFSQVLIDFEQVKPLLSDNAYVLFHDVSPNIYNSVYLKGLEDYNIESVNEDFRLDEALAVILKENPEYKLINNPMYDASDSHFKETKLNKWVRGTTSPFNSICAIQRNHK